MKIKAYTKNNIGVLEISAKILGDSDAPNLQVQMKDLIARGINNIILDLEAVRLINSIGIGNIVYGNDLYVRPIKGHFEYTSTDSTKAVNRNLHGSPIFYGIDLSRIYEKLEAMSMAGASTRALHHNSSFSTPVIILFLVLCPMCHRGASLRVG